MTPPEKPFLRLPARRRGVIRRASLWDAGDYLLSISGTTFSERYRRFYYRDVQSIVVQNGPRLGSIGAMLLTLWFTVVLLALAMAPNMPYGFRWVLLLPLLWLMWLIYVNLARSCRVFLFTAVSSEELPAIFRRRSAAKTLPKILNKIAEAQGDFVPDSARPLPSFAPARPDLSRPPTRQIIYSTGLFAALFLVSAALAYWYRSTPWTPSVLSTAKIAAPLLNGLEIASGVWALFKLFRVRLMNSLRVFVVAGLAVSALRGYAFVLSLTFARQPVIAASETFSKLPVHLWILTIDSALSLIIAVAVLLSLMLTWRDSDSRSSESPL